MGYKKRGQIECSEDDKAVLEKIAKSRTESVNRVRRAKIFLKYMENKPVSRIKDDVGMSKESVYKNIDKALAFGPVEALKDRPGRGAPSTISSEAKSWVVSLACDSPQNYDYANELWTYSLLAKHVRSYCGEQGFAELKKAGKSLIHTILNEASIKPHKVSYYLENRDEDFEEKMAQVLAVYKEVQLINEVQQEDTEGSERKLTTVAYDEKPGIQAIKNIAPQLLPIPGKHPTIGRDYEYKRLGTLSLLAGIDLHTGKVIPLVKERHRSQEFIEFLKLLNDRYPSDWKIRIVLDNHSSHKSKETMKYLETVPGKFEFVFTPKHGSWLNLVEIFFSKIARTFLREIRVSSVEDLQQRIYKGIEQSNQEPVIFKWNYKIEEV